MNQLIKRHAVICLLITSSICAHAQWGGGNGIMGEGPTVRKTINLEDINGFSLGLPANVYLKKGKQKIEIKGQKNIIDNIESCLLYTSPSPRDATLSRMPSSA